MKIKKTISMLLVISLLASLNVFSVSAMDIDSSDLANEINLPVEDTSFSMKIDESLPSDVLVSTDLDALEKVTDEGYYDTVYVTKYVDNEDDELYFYKVPEGAEGRELSTPSVAGTENVSTEELSDEDIGSIARQSRAIIGSDDRAKVTSTTTYPYSAIVQLDITWSDGCTSTATGFMIGTLFTATAGHNIYDESHGGWAKKIYVYPGRNGTSKPFGTVQAIGLTVSENWKKNNDDDYDFGVLQLYSGIGYNTGYFGFKVLEDDTTGTTATITGYPTTVPSGASNTMWTHSYSILQEAIWMLYYRIDASEGQDGAPIYYLNTDTDVENDYIAIGIHTGDSGSLNHGVKFSEEVFDFYEGYAW